MDMTHYKSDDITLLLPPFRERVVILLDALKGRGHEPVLFDGLRTPEEAQRNAQKGVGVLNSMHLYGIAADIICGKHGWSCEKADCHFFAALGLEAMKLGLTWGGTWRRRDMPHVQAIAVKDQTRFRRLKPEEREPFVRAILRDEASVAT